MRKRMWLWFWAMLLSAMPAWADDPDTLCSEILKAVARPVGLAHLPRCGDGSLALALAKADPGLLVHGQDRDAANVARSRKAADDRGVLGRRIWFDQGGLARLLPVGRSCDLIVMTDLTAGDLTPDLAREIGRVLHPWYGAAVLGDAAGKLDAAALSAWARTISPLISPMPGRESLVRVKAGPLPESDDWSHWWHGPDNNAVSSDTAFTEPETVQWTGRPYFSTRVELPIVSGGRVFMLWNGDALDMSPGKPVLAGVEGDGPLLTAQAVGSGARLWARRLSPAAWLQICRSTMVADGTRLLVADGPRILELDAAAGTELRKAEADCGEVRWLAVADGYLLLLGGPATENLGQRATKQIVPFRSSGLLLAAWKRDSMKEVWRVQRERGPDAFDPRSPAVSGGRLFVCTEGGEAEAYALADGQRQWKTATGIARLAPRQYEWDYSSRHPVTGYALEGLYILSGPETSACAVLSQQDGRKMWDLPRGQWPVGPIPLAIGGMVWIGNRGLDPEAGKAKATVHIDNGGCSRLTAAPQGFLGTCGLTWDLKAGKPRKMLPAKSSCGAGSLVANGLIWQFPSACTNCTEWRGFIARAAAEKPPDPPARLVASTGALAPGSAANGWLTHRGNDNRSASIAALVGDKAEILWAAPPVHPAGPASIRGTVMLDPEIVPAPPVIAGNLAIVAGGDGAVDALDLGDGKRRWRAFTGGRVASSPTAWRGRVFVGSADGCLYAFALADGQELWRLRVAPDAGRAMVFGQLGSRWPVLSSPLVVGDRVFITAGLLDAVDGVHCVAADAATGRILWERSDWSCADFEGRRMLSGAGQLCWDGAAVCYHGGEAPPVRMAPGDGACLSLLKVPTTDEIRKRRLPGWEAMAMTRDAKGQDVGSLLPGWLVYGGRRLFTDQAEVGTWGNGLTFLSRKSEDGRPLLRTYESVLMPAWDDRDILFIVDIQRHNSLVAIPRTKMETTLADRVPVGKGNAETGDALSSVLRTFSLKSQELARWRVQIPFGTAVLGCALTDNAALLVTGTDRPAAGKLSAFSRSDGRKTWEVTLRSRPVYDGLAVASDGRVIVTLCSGEVVCVGKGRE